MVDRMPKGWAVAVAVGMALLLAACSTSGPTSAGPTAAPLPTATTPAPTPSPTLEPRPSPSVTRTNPPARPSATRTPVAGPTTTRPEPTRTAAAAPAVVLRRGATTAKLVALTFDAGSDAGSTDAILQTLARDRIRATFGLTGAWVRANPALARRVVADGHLVVNHTDRHLSFTGASTGTPPLTRSQRLAALRAADDALRAVVGRGFGPWFRPPYGDRDPSVDIDVGLAGYRYDLMWTVDTLGWRGEPPAGVVRRVMAALVPGAIVLMHVGSGSTDAAALPELVRQLRASGYGFVRADRF